MLNNLRLERQSLSEFQADKMGIQRQIIPLLFLTILQFQLTPINCYGDLNRSRLASMAERNLAVITSHAIEQATKVVDDVVDDLLVLDSQNAILLGYLNRFDAYIAKSDNHTGETLQFFYDIVDAYLDADVAEKTSNIETQLIALCLQRNGFDRWKRTIQLRLAQFHKSFGKKLRRHMDTVDEEERLSLELHWSRVTARGGQRKLAKFRDFVSWLAT